MEVGRGEACYVLHGCIVKEGSYIDGRGGAHAPPSPPLPLRYALLQFRGRSVLGGKNHFFQSIIYSPYEADKLQ